MFKLTNERGEYITDAPNYMMVVHFDIYELEDFNGTLNSFYMKSHICSPPILNM